MKRLNFKLILNKLLLVSFVSFIVAGIYILYFLFIGIPKTQARNYYNLALIQIENGEDIEAEVSLETALTFWNEKYIQDTLVDLQARNK